MSKELNPLLERAAVEKGQEKVSGIPVFNMFNDIARRYGDYLRVNIPVPEKQTAVEVKISRTNYRLGEHHPMKITVEIESLPLSLEVNELGSAHIKLDGSNPAFVFPYSPEELVFDQEMSDCYTKLADIIEQEAPIDLERKREEEEKRRLEKERIEIEKPKVLETTSQMYVQADELLHRYGKINPESKGLKKAVNVLKQRKKLRCELPDENNEESIHVLISFYPNKNNIIIAVSGSKSRLKLTKTASKLLSEYSLKESDVRLEELIKWQNILSKVNQKLNPSENNTPLPATPKS